MLYIKFANDMRQPYDSALETEEFYNGSSRRTLTFRINPNATNLQTLSDTCTEENCTTLELSNELEGITNIYEGYVLRLEIGIKSETDSETGETSEYVLLKLGKRTFIEQKLHELGIG